MDSIGIEAVELVVGILFGAALLLSGADHVGVIGVLSLAFVLTGVNTKGIRRNFQGRFLFTA